MKLQGSIVALITPFKDGKVDENSLKNLIKWHLEAGTHGILVLGTTGEAPAIDMEERKRIMEITLEEAKGKVPLIVGTGTNNTKKVFEYTKLAEEMGFDAALIVTPYYNKPSQNGLYEHYSYIAKNTQIPIILYNVPGRTGVNLLPDTTARLSQIENIVAIKEACGDIKQVTELVLKCSKDFTILSGDDFTAYATVMLGGKGVVSVAANVMPKEMAQLMELALNGDVTKAQELNLKLYSLYKAMFVETNPVPAKTALWLMGKIETPEVRLPLAQLTEKSLETLKIILKETYNLI
ncbi:MAG: 4-hydroxy-tetrahydrodipicolinate synthase/N-acetylneuraminate lyase [Thermodesulfobacterium sp.]|uniref:4-hydroxy-tetrahydrodipicolinate synthase n=1 Tax=Candidatus Thermodesulfobacterium syntrophicum TaxID=3060442 RepID=A0AAE3P508_9BACT|nr:4-hydroxy-tetrahydrodipicolinate synthase/N-acetylneuraminate lyase [Candidatus Thermodesulfobacterium syntrophicum]